MSRIARRFAEVSGPVSEHDWDHVQRVAALFLTRLAQSGDVSFAEAVKSVPSHFETIAPRVLQAMLVTTPLLPLIDEVAGQSRFSSEDLLKPLARSLRAVHSFASSGSSLETGLHGTRWLIESGRTHFFTACCKPR